MKLNKILLVLVTVGMLGIPTFASAETINKDFKDLPKTGDHYDAIMSLVESGSITGYEDGTFRPHKQISREHVAVILARELDLSVPKDLKRTLAIYEDVNLKSSYAEEIASVTQADIFKGSNGKFTPKKEITREQLATVFKRGFDLGKIDAEKVKISFKDVDPSHKDGVQVLANLGLTNQLEYYNPRGNLKRGQFASFLYRTLDALKNDKPYDPEEPKEPDNSEPGNMELSFFGFNPYMYVGDEVGEFNLSIKDLKTGKFTPIEGAERNKVIFEIDDPTVMSYKTGKFTALKEGKTRVTAKYNEASKSVNFTIRDELEELRGYNQHVKLNYESFKQNEELRNLILDDLTHKEQGIEGMTRNEIANAIDEAYNSKSPIVKNDVAFYYNKKDKQILIRYNRNN